jgi:phage terminase large subunit-like protein
MLDKNIYFNIESNGNKGKPGIKPNTGKMARFITFLPKFKSKEVYFPIELKDEEPMSECMNELTLASKGGFKSKHDDFIDCISQLSCLTVWRPSEVIESVKNKDGIYEFDEEEVTSGIDSYIV